MLEMEEIPEQDRRLAVSGVGRRVGETVGDGEAMLAGEHSTLVLILREARRKCERRGHVDMIGRDGGGCIDTLAVDVSTVGVLEVACDGRRRSWRARCMEKKNDSTGNEVTRAAGQKCLGAQDKLIRGRWKMEAR